MPNVLVDNNSLINIASAIRNKGIEGTWKPAEMPEAIASIVSGGGSSLGNLEHGSIYNSASTYKNFTLPTSIAPESIKFLAFGESNTSARKFVYCPILFADGWRDGDTFYMPLLMLGQTGNGSMSSTVTAWSVQLKDGTGIRSSAGAYFWLAQMSVSGMTPTLRYITSIPKGQDWGTLNSFNTYLLAPSSGVLYMYEP